MYYVKNSSSNFPSVNQMSQKPQTVTKTLSVNPGLKVKAKEATIKNPYFSIADVDIRIIQKDNPIERHYKSKEKKLHHENLGRTTNGFFPKTNIKTFSNDLNPLDKKPSQDNLNTANNFFKANSIQIDNNRPANHHSNENTKDIREISKEYARKLHTSYSNRKNDYKMVQELKEKMRVSDPFFVDKFDFHTEKFNKEKVFNKENKTNYFESDVFFQKDCEIKKDKSIDKFILDTSFKAKPYGISNKSNSEWSPKHSKCSLLNHTSVPFSLVNTRIKSISKTKEEIGNESICPTNKQKAICEFLDLTRVFNPNPNNEFLKAHHSSRDAFFQKSNLCANYLNLHGMYGSLCERPFVKKII